MKILSDYFNLSIKSVLAFGLLICGGFHFQLTNSLLAETLSVKNLIGASDIVLVDDLPDFLNVFPWVKPELYMTLSDECLMLDPKDGLPEWDWLKAYLRSDLQDDIVTQNRYESWTKLLLNIDTKRRFYYIETYFRKLRGQLTKTVNQYKSWSAKVKSNVRHDANVTHTPDDQSIVSDRAGFSYEHDLTLSYKFRRKEYATPKLTLKAGETSYFNSDFETRESQDVDTQLEVEFLTHSSKWLKSIKPMVGFRVDYFDSGNGKEIGFQTMGLGVRLTSRPLVKKVAVSDIAMGMLIVGVGYRDYKNTLEYGTRGDDRDAMGQALTFVGVSIKDYKDLRHKSTLTLYIASSNSDDPNQEFISNRSSVRHLVGKDKWEVGPEFVFSNRGQKDYDAISRRDNGYDFKLKSYYKHNQSLKFGLDLGHKKQDSSQGSFDYNNTYVVLGGEWKLNFKSFYSSSK